MVDMPQNLQSLPPEVLDVLRFYGASGKTSAHADEIIEGTGLSDRGFGKAIRRLVTSTYLVMDGDQVYRLSDAGRRAVADVLEYDLEAGPALPDSAPAVGSSRMVERRLVLAAPRTLAANQPAIIRVGFDSADEDGWLSGPTPVVVRFSAVHGEAGPASEATLQIENKTVVHSFQMTPGDFTKARLRVELFQSDEFGLDIEPCGGLYLDVPVGLAAETEHVASGVTVSIRELGD